MTDWPNHILLPQKPLRNKRRNRILGGIFFMQSRFRHPRRRIRCSYLILDFTLPILIAAVLGICFKSLLLPLGTILPLY